MTPIDYGRSFITGNGPANEVRFWVESRTRIFHDGLGTEEEYVQTGSCKSENTFVENSLFHEDNYDFLPVFGPEYSVIYRRNVYLNPGYKSVVASSDLWNGQKYHLVEPESSTMLSSNDEILSATYENRPLIAQTEIRDETTHLRAVIEYPVKTMNTNRAENLFQVDTGPVAYPDVSSLYERTADCISLAFIAFNVPQSADFILEVPTALPGGGPRVYHFSKQVSLRVKNRIYAT